MYVPGYVKGRKFDVLIDSGASASCINSEVVKRLKIPTTKKKEVTTVAFGNGQPTIYERASNITTEDDPYEFQVSKGLLYLKNGMRVCISDLPAVKTILMKELHDTLWC